MFVQVTDLVKNYGEGDSRTQVLRGISTGIRKGTMCAIKGPSGSGKSTFLNCIGGLETPDSGSIVIDGQEIAGLRPAALSEYRREKLGFVFQFYNLVPDLTIRENIEVCRFLTPRPLDMEALMKTLGIYDHRDKFPSQLSGGQQQRTAIARALVKNPALLLCDEPTGALDSQTSRGILTLLEEVNRLYGTTILIVTHNNAIPQMTHRVIEIRDGQISREYDNEVLIPAAELQDL